MISPLASRLGLIFFFGGIVGEYTKQWLSVEAQIRKLASRGLGVPDVRKASQLLHGVGYYRLTGYLYPFREAETYLDDEGRQRVKVLSGYRCGASIEDAAALIDFDRQLRMLILDGIERIEVSLRMQVGYVLGRRSAFAHLEAATFVKSFTDSPGEFESELPNLSKQAPSSPAHHPANPSAISRPIFRNSSADNAGSFDESRSV